MGCLCLEAIIEARSLKNMSLLRAPKSSLLEFENLILRGFIGEERLGRACSMLLEPLPMDCWSGYWHVHRD